ncbi:MAG: GNAT family N-acetyltransferase, partial [Hydrogenovibrio sp.]
RLVPFDQAWWLRGLFILPEYRQQGFAHQLIRTLQCDTDAVIYAFARPALQAFYQRLGFEPISPMDMTAALQSRLKTYHKSQPRLSVYRYDP